MLLKRILQLLLLYKFTNFITAGLEPRWTYDYIDIATYSSNHDFVDLDLKIERMGRSDYGVSGFINLKQDLYDDVFAGVTVLRSKDRYGSYTKTPLAVANKTLTATMNDLYKNCLMKTAKNCTKNAPIFQKFKAPLTKRFVEITKCKISTEYYPVILMDGYYIIRIKSFGPFDMCVEILVVVENKIF